MGDPLTETRFLTAIKPLKQSVDNCTKKLETYGKALYGPENEQHKGVMMRTTNMERVLRLLVLLAGIFVTAAIYTAVDKWFGPSTPTTIIVQPGINSKVSP